MRRCITGQVDHVRDRLASVGVLIVEAARNADARPESRWVAVELAERAARVAEEIAELRHLHERMVAGGLSPAALAAPPLPLVLKRPAPPLMPIEASVDVEPKQLAGGAHVR